MSLSRTAVRSMESATIATSHPAGEFELQQSRQQCGSFETRQCDQVIQIVALSARQMPKHRVRQHRIIISYVPRPRSDEPDLFQDIVHILDDLCAVFEQGVGAAILAVEHVARHCHNLAALFERQSRRDQRSAPRGGLNDHHSPRQSTN